MDIEIKNGDWVHENGTLAMIEGTQEILQHARIRLQAKKGGFYSDPSFGSRLHELKGQTGKQVETIALEYAGEALAEMPEVWPKALTWDGAQAVIQLSVRGAEREVTIQV